MRFWRTLSIGLCLLGIGTAGALAAGSPPGMESMKAYREMQQNITWTVEGLQQLGKLKDRKLALNKSQVRKILPVYQELIAKKIIRVEPGKRDAKRSDFRPSGPGGPDEVRFQRRSQEMAMLTKFGTAKMDRINRILTPGQRSFIDNMDFQPEQYGYFKMQGRAPGMETGHGNRIGNGNGNGVEQGGNWQRSEHRRMRERNPKLEAARQHLFKLNREVLEMLKRMQ